jgi:hypothetical protein
MEKHSLIRTVYLYLFALIGLVLLTIGSVKFADMGLKTFVFTKAEDPDRIRQEYGYYSSFPVSLSKMEEYGQEEGLSEEERASIAQWLEDYNRWQEEESKIDYVASQKHREASNNLAFILIGLPLYLFHWRIIKRESA